MATTEELVIKLTADNSDLRKKLSESEKGVSNFGGAVSKLAPMIAGAFTVGAIVNFSKAAYLASEQQAQANRRLLSALNQNQAAFRELTNQAEKLRSETGVDDATIMQIQQLAASSGKATSEIKRITEASVELAARTGQDLQSAYMQINATYTGTAGRLSRLDAEFATLTEEQLKNGGAVDLILEKYKGFAKESATELQKLKSNWEEFQETVGTGIAKVVNPALSDMNSWMREITLQEGFWRKLNAAINPLHYIIDKTALSLEEEANQLERSSKNATDYYRSVLGVNQALKGTETLFKMGEGKGAVIIPPDAADTIKDTTTALERYIRTMEEAYRKQQELEPYNVPLPERQGNVSGVMQPKGLSNSIGNIALLTKRVTKSVGEEINASNEKLQDQIDLVGQLSYVMSGFGEAATNAFGEQSAAAKAFAVGQVIASAAMGIMGTWAGYAKFGPWGTALAVAQTAMIAGVAATQIGNIAGAFANGGIVGGGSFSGDKMTARVNSGEMILNGNQQRELWAMANGYGQKQQIEVVGYISGDVIRLANKKSEYINGRKA